MSVRTTHYIMLAVCFKYDEFNIEGMDEDDFYDKYREPYRDERDRASTNPTTVIADDMGGRYVVIGLILRKFDDEDGIDMTDINDILDNPEQDAKAIERLIRDRFSFLDLKDRKPAYLIFTHYA